MGLISFLGSVVSAAANVVKTAFTAVVEVAKKAINWIADRGPVIWEGIRTIWNITKKVIKPVLIVLSKTLPFPILRAIAKILVIAIEILERLLDTATAEKIRKAIQWCIDAAAKLRNLILSEGERREAVERRELFQKAMISLQDHDEERRAIAVAKLINEFVLLQNEINDYLSDQIEITDYDHYLRIRATHKLIDLTEQKLKQDINLVEITDDDMFILEMGNRLVSEVVRASDEELERLDEIIYNMSGKKLLPFVFEELLLGWTKLTEENEREWEMTNNALAKAVIELRNAENTLLYGGQPVIDIPSHKRLIDELTQKLDAIARIKNDRWMMIDAAEGFLEILENNEKVAGKTYLLNRGEKVGRIIIGIMEMNHPMEELAESDRMLLIDFAHIFSEERKRRIDSIPTIEVEVGA